MNLKPKRLTDHTKAETGIWTDMGVALLTGVACYLAATWYDWPALWAQWRGPLATFGLDRLPPLLLALLVSTAWFAWRRWRAGVQSNRLWVEVSRHLEEEIARRESLQRSERETRRKLELAFRHQRARTERILRIREMSDLVLSSDRVSEIFQITSKYLPQILPFQAGAIFHADGHGGWRANTAWGSFKGAEDAGFDTADCWALRRNKPYDDSDCEHSGLCRHAAETHCAKVLCIPIACRGETFGIIHLRDDAPGEPDTDGAAHSNRVEDRELGTTIGETLGLHLFNLSLREELSRESTRDPLTGVLNRRGLIAALNEHLDARAAGRNLAVLLLDVDHFKRVNDTHGHDVGDAVLTALARVVDSRIRDRDLLARWGGEEFIVVLPDTDLSTALLRAEQIRRSIARLKIDYEQTQLKDVTASIGVAARPQHARHWDDLVNIADKALYEAKQRGRNRVIEGAADVPPNNTIPFERKR